MHKLLVNIKNKITCEVLIVITTVFIILGSILPFQTVGKKDEYTYIQSDYKIMCIISIVLLIVALVLAIMNLSKILRWYLFLIGCFIVFACFFLFVESMRHHYAEGKTEYSIGTYLYFIGTILSTILGMYSLENGVKTFRSKNK